MSDVVLSGPRLTVAGLRGDSGKTLVSLGLVRAAADRGLEVHPFKKGPDYIDASWLAAAGGRPCRNLDTYLMSDAALGAALDGAPPEALVVVEGNRGLFDGLDAEGSHSTAALARRLGAPVLLVVETAKMTRTAAALVLGCRCLEPDLPIAGVILNRVATARQESVIRRAIEAATDVPVLGAIPRLAGDDPLPGRHLGLVTAVEHPRRDEAIARAADAVRRHVDLAAVLAAAERAPRAVFPRAIATPRSAPIALGVFADEAFSFYYPENLEGLEAAGVRLVPVSPASDRALPDVDALYIGGGFPEVHATRLADNREFARQVRARAAGGLPIYAECGGLMYLARELQVDGAAYPMAGVLDLVVEQRPRPQGHGYVAASVACDNPFFARGGELRGHEFHYSRVLEGRDLDRSVLRLDRGTGLGGGRDGLVKGRVWASYLHLHAAGTPQWADGLLELAVIYATERSSARAAWA